MHRRAQKPAPSEHARVAAFGVKSSTLSVAVACHFAEICCCCYGYYCRHYRHVALVINAVVWVVGISIIVIVPANIVVAVVVAGVSLLVQIYSVTVLLPFGLAGSSVSSLGATVPNADHLAPQERVRLFGLPNAEATGSIPVAPRPGPENFGRGTRMRASRLRRADIY